MAPIVAPNVARFTLNGTYYDNPVATVLDIEPAIVTGAAPSRGDFLESCAERLWLNFAVFIAPFNVNLVYENISYVDLDSAQGLVGQYIPAAPAAGTGAGEPMPGSVAARFNKGSGGFQRGQRAGRMYIAGVLEAWTGNLGANILQENVVDVLQAAADNFMEDLALPTDSGNGGTYSPNLVVVHTSRPTPQSDPVFTGATSVEALGVQARLASQVRRLRL